MRSLNRNIFTAATLVVTVMCTISLVIFLFGQKTAWQERYSDVRLYEVDAGCSPLLPGLAACIGQKTKSAMERDAVLSQREAAFWSFWTTLIAAATGVVSIGGLIILYRTLSLTHHSADIARRQFVAAERAWIKITDVKLMSGLTWDAELKEGRIHLQVTYENRGRSPAYDARVITKLNPVFGKASTLMKEFVESERTSKEELYETLLPNDVELLEIDDVVHPDDIKKAVDFYVSMSSKDQDWDPWTNSFALGITVIVCATYVTMEETHQTAVAFDLLANGLLTKTPFNGNVPFEELELRPAHNGKYSD